MPESLQAYQFRVRARALEAIQFQCHMGASLRGAFLEALPGQCCGNSTTCSRVQVCPMSSLIAPLRNETPRIRDVPRPFAIRPPVDHQQVLLQGDTFSFGLTLFGRRLDLFPYIALAFQTMGTTGIGQKVEANHWRRGRFVVEDVSVVNALTGEEHVIQTAGSRQCTFPDLPTRWEDAQKRAAELPDDLVTVRLLTPLRLQEQDIILTTPQFRPFIERLVERHDFLCLEYGGTLFSQEERLRLLALAEQIETVHDETRWTDVRSYSSRTKRGMQIGGLTGQMTYQGHLQSLLPLLVWGTVLQAGKATTKGNGVYEIVRVHAS